MARELPKPGEALDREVGMFLTIEPTRSFELALRWTTTRHPAKAPIPQALLTSFPITLPHSPEMPHRHPEQLAGLFHRQPASRVPLKRILKPRLKCFS